MNANGTYKNPLFALYRDMVAGAEPELRRAGPGSDRTTTTRAGFRTRSTAQNFGGRIDYNHSESDRFFFRASGTTFYEYNVDWTYENRSTTGCTRTTRRAPRGRTPATGRRSAGRRSSTRSSRRIASTRISSGGACTSTSPRDVGLPELPRRVLPGGEQLHAARHQRRAATRACRPPPTAALDDHATSRRRAPSPTSRATTRCAAASTTAWRCAGADLMTAGNVSSTYTFDNTLHARGGHDRGLPGQQHRPEPGGPDARASRRRCRSARTRRSR